MIWRGGERIGSAWTQSNQRPIGGSGHRKVQFDYSEPSSESESCVQKNFMNRTGSYSASCNCFPKTWVFSIVARIQVEPKGAEDEKADCRKMIDPPRFLGGGPIVESGFTKRLSLGFA
jgi:hypothetical protein